MTESHRRAAWTIGFLVPRSRRLEPETQVSAGGAPRGLPPGRADGVSSCVPAWPSSGRVHVGLGVTPGTPFTLTAPSKAPSPSPVTLWGAGGQSSNIRIWGWDTVEQITLIDTGPATVPHPPTHTFPRPPAGPSQATPALKFPLPPRAQGGGQPAAGRTQACG